MGYITGHVFILMFYSAKDLDYRNNRVKSDKMNVLITRETQSKFARERDIWEKLGLCRLMTCRSCSRAK